ncbi:MAG: hypothetical protein ACI9FN_002908 [Saprospiraceae bacterium]|jgi:hypothetical protein
MGRKKLIICFLLSLYSIALSGQYKWQARDPIDLNFIDFGDNKLLLYNGLGVGITSLFSKGDHNNLDYKKQFISLQYFREYQRSPLSQLISLNYRRRWQIRNFLFIGTEVRGYHVRDTEVSTQGLGMSMTFEWHLIRQSCFRLIYDNGVGPNIFLKRFPFGGTKFNFTTNYGIRIAQLIGERWWSIGIHNIHISNAEIKGRNRNPALDAIGISIGLNLD